jgi:protein-disulfide isomerase
MSKKSADRSRAERAQAAIVEQRRAEQRRRMIVVGSIVGVLVLVVAAFLVINSMRDTTGETPETTPGDATSDYGLVVGDGDAPTEIAIYEDPQCANAMVATYDVAGPEVFEELHQTLYAEQTPEGGPGHSDDQLVEFAVEAGADEAEIRPLIEDGAYLQWIENATDAMSRNGVTGTPTVFVDGELAENPLEGIRGALE